MEKQLKNFLKSFLVKILKALIFIKTLPPISLQIQRIEQKLEQWKDIIFLMKSRI